jgi:hypothetical protein
MSYYRYEHNPYGSINNYKSTFFYLPIKIRTCAVVYIITIAFHAKKTTFITPFIFELIKRLQKVRLTIYSLQVLNDLPLLRNTLSKLGALLNLWA